MSAPPRPARNDARANADSLMPATPIPIDAAARSLERTASILRPVPARIRFPIRTNAMVVTISTITANGNRAMSPPPRTARSIPNSSGSGIRFSAGSTICGLANTNFSSVSAAARVTTANCAPRIRSAGRPTMMPAAAAPSAASSIENGNGMSVPSFDSRSPATPANAAWANEI